MLSCITAIDLRIRVRKPCSLRHQSKVLSAKSCSVLRFRSHRNSKRPQNRPTTLRTTTTLYATRHSRYSDIGTYKSSESSLHSIIKMSEPKPTTKKFGKGERTVPHYLVKASKYYPAEEEKKPKTVCWLSSCFRVQIGSINSSRSILL